MPWVKGQSGNPAGSKRPSSLARLARSHTVDGLTLVEFAVRVMKGEEKEKALKFTKDPQTGDKITVEVELPPSLEDRMEAMKWLADRGWGKAVETVVLDDEREKAQEPAQVATEALESGLEPAGALQ